MLANFASMVDFSSRVYGYGTKAPSGLNLLGYAGVKVVGAMLKWKGFGQSRCTSRVTSLSPPIHLQVIAGTGFS
jgi:hypothetical protein